MGFDVVLSPVIIRALFRKFILAGFTRQEAGNLIATLMNLEACKTGWTTNELIHLMFEEYRDKENSTRL